MTPTVTRYFSLARADGGLPMTERWSHIVVFTMLCLIAFLAISGCATSRHFVTADGKTWYIITDNPTDSIGWVAEFRPKVNALVGIPYGRMPQDRFFTTREACEYARTHLTFQSTGLARAWSSPEVPPSEPCQSVHYRIEQHTIP